MRLRCGGFERSRDIRISWLDIVGSGRWILAPMASGIVVAWEDSGALVGRADAGWVGDVERTEKSERYHRNGLRDGRLEV